ENFCVKWKETEEMLSYLDVLVDGEFVEKLKDISLRFRGSSNQRIIDIKKSMQTGDIVLWTDEN
ncbi:MAG: 4Fe-4S cluster-binding domain-containing protein, partial [Lachnospiraceae bacterium]|nr:4Fe-4S cluster-binding domain-containing protein [Lachnospiraceae bacterium]